jgi:hypothetical protein
MTAHSEKRGEKKRLRHGLILFFLFTIMVIPFHTPSAKGDLIKISTNQGKKIGLYKDYHALVVGVGNYEKWPRLQNAIDDAEEVAEKLKELGFEVKLVLDPDHQEMRAALDYMAGNIGREKDRALLFYYAGRGETQILPDGTKMGFLVPRDCPRIIEDYMGFVSMAISMKDIQAASQKIRSRHVIMLFDSCFSISYFPLLKAVPKNITEESVLPVRQYITSGREDEKIPSDSMFKRWLFIGLGGDADIDEDGLISGSELGMYLRENVSMDSLKRQNSQYAVSSDSSLSRGDFMLVPLKERRRQAEETRKKQEEKAAALEKKKGLEEEMRKKQELEVQKKAFQDEQASLEAQRRQLEEDRKRFDAERMKARESERIEKEKAAAEEKRREEQKKLETERRKAQESERIEKEKVTAEKKHREDERRRIEKEKKAAQTDDRFIASANGIVKDTKTGLEWVAGPDRDMSWEDAKKWVENLNVAGGGWRMPTMEELRGLYNQGSGDRNMTPLLKTTGWWVWSGETEGLSHQWRFDYYRGYGNLPVSADSNDKRAFAVRFRSDR